MVVFEAEFKKAKLMLELVCELCIETHFAFGFRDENQLGKIFAFSGNFRYPKNVCDDQDIPRITQQGEGSVVKLI